MRGTKADQFQRAARHRRNHHRDQTVQRGIHRHLQGAEMTNTFIQTVEGDVIAIGEAAWTQAKTQLLALGETALADLKTALSTALNAAEAGDSVEDIETAVLNLLSGDSLTLVQALTSGALQLLIAAGKAAVADL
jgi:hypothetical protein